MANRLTGLMLPELFTDAISAHSNDKALAVSLWQEIEQHHNGPGRHYHNLEHLAFLMEQLSPHQNVVHNWEAICYAVFYHDIIFGPCAMDNEEKSAALAAERLSAALVPEDVIIKCHQHILATKQHKQHPDADTNLFTDADLAILGQDEETYMSYCMKVRLEFSHLPETVYRSGRSKVLKGFLQMESIFKTEAFKHYEAQARRNIQTELAMQQQ